MKKTIVLIMLFLSIVNITFSAGKLIYVDKSGGLGIFVTIQDAIDAASEGDTVRILPEIYNEQIVINKDIVVQGGGIANTIISPQSINEGYSVSISSGKLMWVQVSSKARGIFVDNATISNCVVSNCNDWGITCNKNGSVYNCLACNNFHGIWAENSKSIIVNCIAYNNTQYGFGCGWQQTYYVTYCMSYGNGKQNFENHFAPGSGGVYVEKSTGSIEEDPHIDMKTFKISSQSQGVDGGEPTLLDHDKSRSDMGIYGGPDAPLMPYVSLPANIKLNDDGTIQFDLNGKIGY